MSLRVGVDLGTSSTCVAVSTGAADAEVVAVDGRPVFPSGVYLRPDGVLLAGRDAERQVEVDPSRFEPHPKRHLDEGELLLGTTVVPVIDVVRAVLLRAVGEARRASGGAPVDLLALTHPAGWGAVRTRVLRQAAAGLADELVLVPELIAAAACHAADHQPGGPVAVLHIGGCTVAAGVVRFDAPDRGGRGGGFRVAAARHDTGFGGADIDESLLNHIGTEVSGKDPVRWQDLIDGQQPADRQLRRSLRVDIRSAKERLSRYPYADVPMPPPFPDVHLTRADLERLITSRLDTAITALVDCMHRAGLPRGAPVPAFLVGGSSRIPLVARLVHRHTGIIPTASAHPETVVARGALLAAPYPALSGLTVGIAPVRPPRSVPAGPVPPVPVPPVPAKATRRRRRRAVWAAVAVVLLVGAGLAAWLLLLRPAPQISVYDYAFSLPDGWQQTGGSPVQRKVQIGPPGQRGGANSITVQEFRLVDGGSGRNAALLRARLIDHGGFSRIDTSARYAGRNVMSYRERRAEPPAATIRWYVLFSGHVQVSVGCEYTASRADQVLAACQRVVGTMSIRQ